MKRTFSLASTGLLVAAMSVASLAQDKKTEKSVLQPKPPAATAAAPAKKPTDDINPPDPTPLRPTVPGERLKEPLSPDIAGMTRLAKDMDVWIDAKRKLVVVDGRIALREGLLEMFACPKGSKEHESLVAVNAKAYIVHAGLLAVGAKAGTTVKFDPMYVPATGSVVDIYVIWQDAAKKKQVVRAQEWIQHTKTKKPMEYDWVFAGSGFWVDPEDGVKHYNAEVGDFICVSNFPTATLDLPVKSSQETGNLMFQAFTEKIPERGTKVRLVLVPRAEDKKEEKKEETKPATP